MHDGYLSLAWRFSLKKQIAFLSPAFTRKLMWAVTGAAPPRQSVAKSGALRLQALRSSAALATAYERSRPAFVERLAAATGAGLLWGNDSVLRSRDLVAGKNLVRSNPHCEPSASMFPLRFGKRQKPR